VRLLEGKPMTFEQIYDGLYYPDFGIANQAINELVDEGVVMNEKKYIKDVAGQSYVIREFELSRPKSFEAATLEARIKYLEEQGRNRRRK
jgi:hypothetical protein